MKPALAAALGEDMEAGPANSQVSRRFVALRCRRRDPPLPGGVVPLAAWSGTGGTGAAAGADRRRDRWRARCGAAGGAVARSAAGQPGREIVALGRAGGCGRSQRCRRRPAARPPPCGRTGGRAGGGHGGRCRRAAAPGPPKPLRPMQRQPNVRRGSPRDAAGRTLTDARGRLAQAETAAARSAGEAASLTTSRRRPKHRRCDWRRRPRQPRGAAGAGRPGRPVGKFGRAPARDGRGPQRTGRRTRCAGHCPP